MSKALGKYIAAFNYFDKTLNVVVTTGIIKRNLKKSEIKKV